MRRLFELLSERQRDLYMVSPRHGRQIWNYFHEERGPRLPDRSHEARIDWYGEKSNAKAGTAK